MSKSGLERDVTIIGADIIQPVDIQSHYQQTIQTQNAVSVALNGSSTSSWVDTDGFDRLSIAMQIDSGVSNSVDIYWSTDAVNIHSADYGVLATSTLAKRTTIIETRLRYVQIVLKNQDSALAHTMSAWAYLKA
jgi:DUF4097 and DUF4098 domain-containing protein YvlB